MMKLARLSSVQLLILKEDAEERMTTNEGSCPMYIERQIAIIKKIKKELETRTK